MSSRIRGQEATLKITVNGAPQEGSFVKVKDFTATPRTELVEENYLGETETDLDVRHDGFDLGFSVDMQDRKTIDYLTDAVERERLHLAPPTITINVIYAFRDGAASVSETYHDVVLKIDEQGFGGRTEYISVSFSGKAKKRVALSL